MSTTPKTTSEMFAAIDRAFGCVSKPAAQKSEAQRKREFASHQRRVGAEGIRELRRRRRWIADVSNVQPGIGQFYRYSDDYRAAVIKYALSCRRRANDAAAEARALEASAQVKKAA